MTLRPRPMKCGLRIFPADGSHGSPQTTAAILVAAEASVKAVGDQATFSASRKAIAEDSQADLDEAIAAMVSEGGPNY